SFEEACRAYDSNKSLDGIGYVLGDEDAAIDLDKCRDPQTRKIADWAWDLIDEAKSYCEITPSGTGVRIIGLADGGEPIQTNSKNEHGAGYELYRGRCGRYIAMTGLRLNDESSPNKLTKGINSVIDRLKSERGRKEEREEPNEHRTIDDLLTRLTI